MPPNSETRESKLGSRTNRDEYINSLDGVYMRQLWLIQNYIQNTLISYFVGLL